MLNQKDLWKRWVRDLAEEQGRDHSSTPDDPASPPQLRGLVLGERYRIEEHVQAGGVGFVCLATDLKLDRPVAVKLLKHEFIQHASFRPRFAREARALASLVHPHIVSILDHGVENGQPYLVMEYVNGPTLRALLDAGPLSPRAAFRITKQVLSALAYAHAHQVVHRDIKPANIVVQPVSKTSFHVKVLDFGFAKFLTPKARDDTELSDPGMTFGTPKYMSPEQLLNSSTAGPPADLYALGVVLFEMLAGRPTFVGEIRELVRQHLTDAPPRISELVTGLADPDATEQLLTNALEKRSNARFQNAEAFLAALQALPESASPEPDLTLVPDAFTDAAQTLELSAGDLEVIAPPKPSRRPHLAYGIGAAVALVAASAALTYRLQNTWTEVSPSGVARGEVPTALELEPTPPDGQADEDSSNSEPNALLSAAEAQLDQGDTLSTETIEALLAEVRTHPRDPRPHLLLARLNVARDRPPQALFRYAQAFRADPSVRDDPHIRPDLQALRQNARVSARAERLLARLDETPEPADSLQTDASPAD